MLSKIVPFLKEVKLEIRKINWPARDQTVKYTIIVLGISLTVAIFLGGLDFIFTRILEILIL